MPCTLNGPELLKGNLHTIGLKRVSIFIMFFIRRGCKYKLSKIFSSSNFFELMGDRDNIIMKMNGLWTSLTDLLNSKYRKFLRSSPELIKKKMGSVVILMQTEHMVLTYLSRLYLTHLRISPNLHYLDSPLQGSFLREFHFWSLFLI